MNAEILREYALNRPGTSESFPFNETTLVIKVGGKMFLLIALDEFPLKFNAKADPEKAVQLREKYPDSIQSGYHMNKAHWNTITLDGKLSESIVKNLIDHSYQLVLDSLPKKIRLTIQ